MPLTLRYEAQDNAEWGGTFYPIIVCDFCGERITHARNGNFLWLVCWEDLHSAAKQHTDIPQPAQLAFTHKRCNHAFEAAHTPEGSRWFSDELPRLPGQLAGNLNIEPEQRRESTHKRSKP